MTEILKANSGVKANFPNYAATIKVLFINVNSSKTPDLR